MFKADFNEHRVVTHTNTTSTDKHFRTNVSLKSNTKNIPNITVPK